MSSKTWPATNSFNCQESRQKRFKSDSGVYESYRKRNRSESIERPRKRSKTSSDPLDGCSKIQQALTSCCNLASSSNDNKTSKKRKSSSDESGEQQPADHTQNTSECKATQNSATCFSISQECGNKKGQKRKSKEGTPEPRKRSKTSSDPLMGCSKAWQETKFCCNSGSSSSNDNKTSKKRKSSSDESGEQQGKRSKLTLSPQTPEDPSTLPEYTATSYCREDFIAKYRQEREIGSGGQGAVYEGYRREDNMPVAIKLIPHFHVSRLPESPDSTTKPLPKEVVIMETLKTTKAVVSLLDWYDLDDELILILERPDPCMDLEAYVKHTGTWTRSEKNAKIIVKQLVEALFEVHSKGVFHRDIKLDNILIETGSDVPRVRLIDFGLATFVKSEECSLFVGTWTYLAPELFTQSRYKAEPATVWAVGVLTYRLLHGKVPFQKARKIVKDKPNIKKKYSKECKTFLKSCLSKDMDDRPTLNSLKLHPWLNPI